MRKDLTNQKFGRLTAKEVVRSEPGKPDIWRCECECGGEKEASSVSLCNGHTRSCGCLNAERKAKLDITGQRWGRLVAVKFVGYSEKGKDGKRRALWLWHCDCGNEKIIPATQVKYAGTRSCGCILDEHISNLRKEDITGQRFGRLTASRPTETRDKNGGIIWELDCDCGNKVYKTVNELKTERVLSCGCYFQESRTELAQYRKDFVENTSLSAIVAAKQPAANNTSGHTGVWFDKRPGRWQAYINFQKKRYFLGTYTNIDDAIRAREAAEKKLHDPIILEYWDHLTDERKQEFAEYLREISMGIEKDIPQITDGKGREINGTISEKKMDRIQP